MSQLSFGFEVPDGHVEPDVPRKLSKPRKRRSTAEGSNLSGPVSVQKLIAEAMKEPFEPTLEEAARLAQVLQSHPDFKVLRRLKPCLDYGSSNPHLNRRRVLILDTETTGLDARSEKIIELAMLAVDVDLQSGLPVGQVEIFEGFEDPGKPIPPAIVQITGIDSSMVQGHRLDEACVNEMVGRADLIIAHNAGFDRPFVESRFPIFRDKSWACSFAGIDWKAQGAGSAKLEFLAHECGWFYDAHRAQIDCHALLQVLARPLPKEPRTGLACLIEAAQNVRYKLRAVGAPFESKDQLKARGYRWDNEGRVWSTTLSSEQELQAETEWLKNQIYGARSARVVIEALDSYAQFSARAGQVSQLQL